MTDRSRRPEPEDDHSMDYEREPAPRVPRWVKVLGIVAVVVALLIVIGMLTGIGGEHGPRRHGSLSGLGSTPSAAVIQR